MKRLARLVCAIMLALGISGAANAQTTWSKARNKNERCAALSGWYQATSKAAGRDAFSPHDRNPMPATAYGFADSVFVPAFGFSFAGITHDQRRKIMQDIKDCDPAPVDPMMKDYVRGAFETNEKLTDVDGWKSVITVAMREDADREFARTGQGGSAATARAALPRNFRPYLETTDKGQRCTALEEWYKAGVRLSGPNTFGGPAKRLTNSSVAKNFARAFVDDIFPIFFGAKHGELKPQQKAEIIDSVTTCSTPSVGTWAMVVTAAFEPTLNARNVWTAPISLEAGKLGSMRFQAIPDRAAIAAAVPPAGKAPGPFDTRNRRYSRLIYSDATVNVGPMDQVYTKCQMALEYAVGIDIPRSQPLTPQAALDVFTRVLMPLAQKECPGKDLDINASFFHRTLSAARNGQAAPAGSVEITNEFPMATAMYGRGHRQQNAPPSMYYGGVNHNWPELASFDGLVAFEARGMRRAPAAVAAATPQTSLRYVNYTPSQTPRHLQGVRNGELIGWLAARDFFSIARKGYERSPFAGAKNSASAVTDLFALFGALPQVDPNSDAYAPRKRGFVFAVQAYSEQCRDAIPNAAMYQEAYQVKVGETRQRFMMSTIITQHYKTEYTDPVYMDPAYRSLYASQFQIEKVVFSQHMLNLTSSLGIEEVLGGQSALIPLQTIREIKDAAAAHFSAVGCLQGKTLLANWADYVSGKLSQTYASPARPTQISERSDGEIEVVVFEAGRDTPPYLYSDGTRLHVSHVGARTTGLRDYYASHFNFLFVSGADDLMMKPENAALLRSFHTDRIRILNCFYDNGQANFFLDGYGVPNEAQRRAAGASFKGTAASCPATKPN